MMTITISLWVIPTIITLLAFGWAKLISDGSLMDVIPYTIAIVLSAVSWGIYALFAFGILKIT